MNDSKLKKIFETAHTIVTVGLSTDPEKPAHYIPEYLQTIGCRTNTDGCHCEGRPERSVAQSKDAGRSRRTRRSNPQHWQPPNISPTDY